MTLRDDTKNEKQEHREHSIYSAGRLETASTGRTAAKPAFAG